MDWTGKTVAITGGAGGIGRALIGRFRAAGARVAAGDLDRDGAQDAVGPDGFAAHLDAGDERSISAFVRAVEDALGPIDCFVANAGVGVSDGPSWAAAGASDKGWDLCWRVNTMQSVWAARHVVPGMVERGHGTFVVVASAAGLLNMVGDAAYTSTKHAAVAFAESLAIAHADQGLSVHCLCPEGVKTNMTKGLEHSVLALSGFVEPSHVADALFAAMEGQHFMVFTHEATPANVLAKTTERDRWLGGLRKIRRAIVAERGAPL